MNEENWFFFSQADLPLALTEDQPKGSYILFSSVEKDIFKIAFIIVTGLMIFAKNIPFGQENVFSFGYMRSNLRHFVLDRC